MKRVISKSTLFFLMISLLVNVTNVIFAQNDNNERYNLAIYATGTQNDQPLSNSLLDIVHSKTMTKLTNEGNYRLIERSNEFLRQIQNEQTMQQSGDVADGQIAEIGAGYGAQKICVVSVTIIDKYLYIATRIVDVATKTSYESGDAEVSNYKDIPVLTKTLEMALNKMLSVAAKTNTPVITPAKPTQPVESTKPTKVSTTTPIQPETPRMSNTTPTKPSGNQTVAEAKAQAAMEKAEAEKAKEDFKAYKKQVIKEKAGFLGINSMAYKKYKDYKTYLVAGTTLTCLAAGCVVFYTTGLIISSAQQNDIWIMLLACVNPFFGGFAISGITLLCLANKRLEQSYNYYLNGDQRTASLQFYPYYGGNNTFGAGLSLRF